MGNAMTKLSTIARSGSWQARPDHNCAANNPKREENKMTDVVAWTCQMALVIGVALFGVDQACAADGADITNEMQKWCNLYDTTWEYKDSVTVANTLLADDVVFIPPNGAVIKGISRLRRYGAMSTRNRPFRNGQSRRHTQRVTARGLTARLQSRKIRRSCPLGWLRNNKMASGKLKYLVSTSFRSSSSFRT